MAEQLDIEIDADGKVHVHVKGMPGKSCLSYVEVFRQLLGPTEEPQLTEEAYRVVEEQHKTEIHRRIELS
jgi:hypothetical protein